jgi:hypothetical protein
MIVRPEKMAAPKAYPPNLPGCHVADYLGLNVNFGYAFVGNF